MGIDELAELVKHDKVKLLLGKLGVAAEDSEALFHVLDDDGSGHIPRNEFISGIKKVKGEARSMDLIPVVNHTKKILTLVENLQHHGDMGHHVQKDQISQLVTFDNTPKPQQPQSQDIRNQDIRNVAVC